MQIRSPSDCPVCGRPASDAAKYGCPWSCASRPKSTLLRNPSTPGQRLKFVLLVAVAGMALWAIAFIVASAAIPPLKRLAGPFVCPSSYEGTYVEVKSKTIGHRGAAWIASDLYCVDVAGRLHRVDDGSTYGSMALMGGTVGAVFGIVVGIWLTARSAGALRIRHEAPRSGDAGSRSISRGRESSR